MIQVRESFFPFAALTHAGLLRVKNEDRYAITAFRSDSPQPVPGLLAVLCDGVGGESAGEVAAELAVDTITRQVLASFEDDPIRVLPAAIQTANEAILAQVHEHPSLAGMAATAACVWISGRRLNMATLGDSRIYLLRGTDQITQLSTDHTWVQEALETGEITLDQKVNHPNAHIIRRFLGSELPPEVDMHIHFPDLLTENQLELLPGDIVFLCTDGCSDLVSPQEIREHFSGQKLEKSLEETKKLAFERGGRDNITMIAIQIPDKAVLTSPRKNKGRAILIGIAVILAIAAGIALGWWYQNPTREGSHSAFTPQQFSSTLIPAESTPVLTITPISGFTPTAQADLECG